LKQILESSSAMLQQRKLSEQFSSGPGPHLMTPGILNSGLVPNPPPSTPYVPPTKNNWDLLFQPIFDEFFDPSSSVVSLVLAVVARRPPL
ncbi:hypothetical protein Tco_1157839, partial [Tanacetum coccineum]